MKKFAVLSLILITSTTFSMQFNTLFSRITAKTMHTRRIHTSSLERRFTEVTGLSFVDAMYKTLIISVAAAVYGCAYFKIRNDERELAELQEYGATLRKAWDSKDPEIIAQAKRSLQEIRGQAQNDFRLVKTPAMVKEADNNLRAALERENTQR